jgi:hypothetical protein
METVYIGNVRAPNCFSPVNPFSSQEFLLLVLDLHKLHLQYSSLNQVLGNQYPDLMNLGISSQDLHDI